MTVNSKRAFLFSHFRLAVLLMVCSVPYSRLRVWPRASLIRKKLQLDLIVTAVNWRLTDYVALVVSGVVVVVVVSVCNRSQMTRNAQKEFLIG